MSLIKSANNPPVWFSPTAVTAVIAGNDQNKCEVVLIGGVRLELDEPAEAIAGRIDDALSLGEMMAAVRG